ncbi:hypothetical protein GCM10027091_36940 [Streptomyces daliensis]
MVEVKTRVPETKATPSMTASTVISSLALCARTLRKAVRNMSVSPEEWSPTAWARRGEGGGGVSAGRTVLTGPYAPL